MSLNHSHKIVLYLFSMLQQRLHGIWFLHASNLFIRHTHTYLLVDVPLLSLAYCLASGIVQFVRFSMRSACSSLLKTF